MNQIHNESAYNAAVKNYIIANALKTFRKSNEDIVDFLYGECASKNTFIRAMYDALFRDYGKLTEKQCEAVRKIINGREERKKEWLDKRVAEKDKSEWVGTVGERAVIELTIKHVIDLEGLYGWTGLFICKTAEGSKVIYKGTSGLGDVGEKITVKATIKEHGVREGEKQTVIARPKIC